MESTVEQLGERPWAAQKQTPTQHSAAAIVLLGRQFAIYSGTKKEAFIKLIDNFNTKCNEILVKSFKTKTGYRYEISEVLKSFLENLIRMRNKI